MNYGIFLQQGSMALVFFLCCHRQSFGCIEQRPWAKSAEWRNTTTWVQLNFHQETVCESQLARRYLFVEWHALSFLHFWPSEAPRLCLASAGISANPKVTLAKIHPKSDVFLRLPGNSWPFLFTQVTFAKACSAGRYSKPLRHEDLGAASMPVGSTMGL